MFSWKTTVPEGERPLSLKGEEQARVREEVLTEVQGTPTFNHHTHREEQA